MPLSSIRGMTDPPAASSRAFGPAAGAAGASFLVMVAAAIARQAWEPFSVASAFAVVVGLGLALLAPRARSPKSTAVAAFTVLGWVPLLAGGALEALDDPIVASPYGCGLGSMGLIVMAPILVGVCLLISGSVAGGAGRRLLDPGMRMLATAAAAAGLAFLAFIAITRHAEPTPDGYIASLPVVDRLELGASAVSTHTGDSWRVELRLLEPPFPAGACAVDLAFRGESRPDSASRQSPGCAPVVVLRDDRADLFIVALEAGRKPLSALSPEHDSPVDVTPRMLAAHLRPPSAWILGASLGLALALFLLVHARRLRARGRDLTLVEATHRGRGWIDLGEGPSVQVPAAALLDVGTVLLDLAPGTPGAAYRGSGAPEVRAVLPGSLDDQRASLAERAASFDGCALVTLILAFVPLVIAQLVGL